MYLNLTTTLLELLILVIILQLATITCFSCNNYGYKRNIMCRYNNNHYKMITDEYRDVFNENQNIIKGIKRLLIQSTGALLSISSSMENPNPANAINSKPSNRYGAIGYEASESAFSPGQRLVAIPLLPQSSLLNTLPLDNELVGQLQAFIESFVQLINPSSNQINQINQNTSALWSNLKINAQRAAGMFLYNQKELLPINNSSSFTNISTAVSATESNSIREKYAQIYLDQLQNDLIELVNNSRACNRISSLQSMQRALNTLCNIAYLLVPVGRYNFETYTLRAGDSSEVVSLSQGGVSRISRQLLTIPRLQGRAMVRITVRRVASREQQLRTKQSDNNNTTFNQYNLALPPLTMKSTSLTQGGNKNNNNNNIRSDRYYEESFTLLVDGVNHPLTAGNFIDLCQKGFYENTKIEIIPQEFEGNQNTNFTIFGRNNLEGGYIDPITLKQRRIPLEIFRENSTRIRYTALGSAKNSVVFTKAVPVQSFATYGAIGMYHSRDNPNDASSAFFWCPISHNANVTMDNLHASPLIKRLDQKYSLFAYVIEGLDVLSTLQQSSDVILNTDVQPGVWKLIPPSYDNILIDYDIIN